MKAKLCIHFKYSNPLLWILKMKTSTNHKIKSIFQWWVSQKTRNEYKVHQFFFSNQTTSKPIRNMIIIVVIPLVSRDYDELLYLGFDLMKLI